MSRGMIVAIVVPISGAVLIFIVGICCFNKRTRKKNDSESELGIGNLELLQYDFRTIKAATNNFSTDNKIGKGGFGEVYKGMLANGQEIAVKILSPASYHGVEVFKNEVEELARIQHRNLLRLLGFCAQREEKMLVYEYMTNKSLEHILFDPKKKKQLNWSKRHKIIKGIARGIQHLHEESMLKIIHRDITARNVLLDDDMNPKITDFGLARIFTFDQKQENGVVVGTMGYLDPAYYATGDYSMKSDVFSFGMLLLEIMSGEKVMIRKKNDGEGVVHLMNYAGTLWKEGKVLELLDPIIRESYDPNEVMRCIHIALLCVEIEPANRPSMSSIVIMLECYSMTLPSPQIFIY